MNVGNYKLKLEPPSTARFVEIIWKDESGKILGKEYFNTSSLTKDSEPNDYSKSFKPKSKSITKDTTPEYSYGDFIGQEGH
jgi:hypothetical protein